MGRLVLNRVLLIIPTLGVISLLAFFIGISSPPSILEKENGKIEQGIPYEQIRKNMAELAEENHLNKPAFYFSVHSLGMPDTLHRILLEKEREAAERLFFQYGDWEGIELGRKHLMELSWVFSDLGMGEAFRTVKALLDDPDWSEQHLKNYFLSLQNSLANPHRQNKDSDLHAYAAMLTKEARAHMGKVYTNRKALALRKYIPSLSWHGPDNRYHHWLSGVLKMDFGKSWVTEQPVGKNWSRFVGMTLRFTLLSALLAYSLSVLLGVWMASNVDRKTQKVINSVLIGIDAIPSFWMATLLLIFFGLPVFGNAFSSVYEPDHESLSTELLSMVMPLITYVLGMLVVLTRLVKSSMLGILDQDFIRTARAKGLPPGKVIWKHALRNALIPLIASLASIFVWLLSGSVIIENIFSIPGLGDKILSGLLAKDLPVIMMVFTLSGLFTALGYLLADLLYMWVDPRIRIGGQHD